MDYYFFYIIII